MTTQVVQDAPLLLTEENSTRAIALDLVLQTRDPFSLTNQLNLSPDQRRRISLFVWRLGVLAGDHASDVTVIAEDNEGHVYPLVVEHITIVPDVADATQVVVRLPDSVAGAPRVLWVRMSLHGPFSNKGAIAIAGN